MDQGPLSKRSVVWLGLEHLQKSGVAYELLESYMDDSWQGAQRQIPQLFWWLFDLEGDGVGVHPVGLSCIAENLRGIVARRRQQDDSFDQNRAQRAFVGTAIRRLAEKVWAASRKKVRIARTVVLKLKTDFSILTRSHTPNAPPSSCEELTRIALSLRERVDLGPQRRYRLVGVGLSNFREAEEMAAHPVLFD